MLLLYLTALKECGSTEHLEVITASFLAWSLGLAKKELETAEEKDKIQQGKFLIAEQRYAVDLNGNLKTRATLDLTKYSLAPPPMELEANEKERPSPDKSEIYIYGQDHVKQEFAKIAAIVRNRGHLTRLFDAKKLFQHYLLVGPPGSGKTTLVRHATSKITSTRDSAEPPQTERDEIRPNYPPACPQQPVGRHESSSPDIPRLGLHPQYVFAFSRNQKRNKS